MFESVAYCITVIFNNCMSVPAVYGSILQSACMSIYDMLSLPHKAHVQAGDNSSWCMKAKQRSWGGEPHPFAVVCDITPCLVMYKSGVTELVMFQTSNRVAQERTAGLCACGERLGLPSSAILV